jgi:hypothetical protein
MGNVRETLVFKILSELTERHIELIKQNCIKLTAMMKQPKSNLNVLSTCGQHRPLSPCHSTTFVKGTAREALAFQLQLNCDTLAYMYYSENRGGGGPFCLYLNFQCGDTNVFFESFWMLSPHLLIFFFWYSNSWCSFNRPNAKATSFIISPA